MTVSYTSDVANGGKFVCFWRVLLRWRGSLYKLIWQDLLCYCTLFIIISYIQTKALPADMQDIVQQLKIYLSSNLSMFPVPFVLSFFVDQVATKWWHQYQMLPSPDTLAIYTNAAIPGKDDKSRIMRRTIVRYTILSFVLTLRNISTRVKNRFQTIKEIEEIGLILEEERMHYDRLEGQGTANMWMPLVWAANVANSARSLKKISSDQCLRLLITELTAHRNKLGILVGYDLVSLPLVYTQTMVVVVVSYTIITLFCHHPVIDENGLNIGSFTIPSLINFIIYVGLMKVATVMLNPLGEDDDDFELNATIDRHIKAGYMIVDEMHEEEPEIVKDAYWDEIVPKELPYTRASVMYRKPEPNCYEEDISKTTKQTRYVEIRRSMVNETNKILKKSFLRKDNKRKSSASKSKNHDRKNNEGESKGHLNRAFSNHRDCLVEEEVDIYEIPDPSKAFSEIDRPSTSKQTFSLQSRC